MKYSFLILAMAAVGLVGCASSNQQTRDQGMQINEPAGAVLTTNSVDTQARDMNQQPLWHSGWAPSDEGGQK